MTMFEDSLKLLELKQKSLDPHNYNIVFFGDSWVGDKGYTSNDIFQAALQEARNYNPLFVLHGGDIVYTGLKENFEFFINFKNKIAPDLPLFVAVGNHEEDRTSPPGPQSVANFQNMIGPLHFTLNIPLYNLTLIVLNTLYHYVYPEYGLTDEELNYLRKNLQQRYLNTFVAMHVPPKTDKWTNPNDVFTIGSEAFFEEIQNKVASALVSHVHAFRTTVYKQTRLILSGGGGATLNKGERFHIVVINVRNNDTCTKRRVAYKVIPIGWESDI